MMYANTSFVQCGEYSFVVLHPNHPVRKKHPEFLYAIRGFEWEGTWDFAAKLIDNMIPMITGIIYQAYTDKDTALRTLKRMG